MNQTGANGQTWARGPEKVRASENQVMEKWTTERTKRVLGGGMRSQHLPAGRGGAKAKDELTGVGKGRGGDQRAGAVTGTCLHPQRDVEDWGGATGTVGLLHRKNHAGGTKGHDYKDPDG